MRILVDYRPALRERTGVGEYIHQLARAYTAAYGEEVLLFTSSWKDRPAQNVSDQTGGRVIDHRIPVRILNYFWHRLEWPPVETLAGPVDVAHSAHPLLIPARNAAQIVTIHDLFFLSRTHDTAAEIRRDYRALAASHAQRAHAVITSTQHGKRQIIDRLGVAADHIYVCPPGAPGWRTLGRQPNVPSDGCILFMGTLEPRKNIGVLLDAYQRLLERRPALPRMVLAGRTTPAGAVWRARIDTAPLAGRVTHIGYVDEAAREDLYRSARVLVMPSLDEGFGLPVLEAMSAGVPVIVSSRGSLPEVVQDAGAQVDPEDVDALSAALERAAFDQEWSMHAAQAGLTRARSFAWSESARTLHSAYNEAVARRRDPHATQSDAPRLPV